MFGLQRVAAFLLWVSGSWQEGSSSDRAETPGCRRQLWDVQPIDLNDNITGGWAQLPVTYQTKIWDGKTYNRTYSHHAIIEHYDETTILLWTSAEVDEDSNGQQVVGSVSHDLGRTWAQPSIILPGALLPNQTQERNFSYWCSEHISQRAWQSESIVRSPVTGIIYAVADSYNFLCSPSSEWSYAAGRVARALDLRTGRPKSDPCWLSQNEFTRALEFQNTVYGTEFDMKVCEERDVLNTALRYPETVPAWSAPLYNHKYLTAYTSHNVREVTRAVYDQEGWQRFWRDEAPENNSWSVWTECTKDWTTWYPNNLPIEGDLSQGSDDTHPIFPTDIPDAKTKQFFGSFATASNSKCRYLVSNPRPHATNLTRYPLTLAWQGLEDDDSSWTFKHIGVVQTRPDPDIAPETRDQYKNPGFSYPSAVQVGGELLLAYSENKENIWVSSVPIAALIDWQ